MVDRGAVTQMGLSLSAAEASVAAPFSSQVPNISSVLEVIRFDTHVKNKPRSNDPNS